MLESAYPAIAGSVAMHVAWNLLVRHQGAQTHMLWWTLALHCATLGLWGLYSLASTALWSRELLFFLLVSASANTLYLRSAVPMRTRRWRWFIPSCAVRRC